MKAMVLEKTGPIEENPLKMADWPVPEPADRQILVKVSACGICHTELDEIEGRLRPELPIILGHEIVGIVERTGPGAAKFKRGDRVGIMSCIASVLYVEFTIEESDNEKNQRYIDVCTVVEHFIRLCHRHHDRIFELTRDRPDFEERRVAGGDCSYDAPF